MCWTQGLLAGQGPAEWLILEANFLAAGPQTTQRSVFRVGIDQS